VAGVLFNKHQTTLIQYPGGKTGSYVIPEGVTSIAASAFSDCAGLTEISMGDSVTNIGSKAFYRCVQLAEVRLSKGLANIGSEAFKGCPNPLQTDLPQKPEQKSK
jgi:hypothetical protein